MMEQACLSVSRLVELFRDLLEENFVDVLVEGEVSNFSRPTSGHCYFTLKDERGQVRCAMFRSQARLLKFQPENGMKVVCRGRASVYTQRGELQLIVSKIEPSGDGGMQMAFDQLKARLDAEGMFSAELKKPLPEHPEVVGVVTSATGAAIHDILNILRRRSSGLKILLRPVRVQGDGAADEISEAIRELNLEGSADVLIVGRGGGSLEDLWAFNEEQVARAIAASKCPVISAVGHEVDVSIADLVADLRAPTPTAAAELVVKSRDELERHCDQLTLRLGRVMQSKLAFLCARLDDLQRRLTSPLETWKQRRENLSQLHLRLQRAIYWQLERHRMDLSQQVQRLDNLSPLKVLGRGYALARVKETGAPLLSASQVGMDEQIQLQLHSGALEARITQIFSEKMHEEP